MKNKAATKIITVYWFAILILVAGGIVTMVSIFYDAPYDVREIEATLLSNKVADCLSQQGRLNDNLIKEGVFNQTFEEEFLEICSFYLEEGEYYSKINFYNVEDSATSLFEISFGNNNLVSDCEIQEDKQYENSAICVEKRFYSLEGDSQYLIKIVSAVKKIEQNVR